MNTNAVHNMLNYFNALVGVLAVFDWAIFGVSAELTVKIVGGLVLLQSIIKVTMNITRDGFTGQFKEQPPVKQ